MSGFEQTIVLSITRSWRLAGALVLAHAGALLAALLVDDPMAVAGLWLTTACSLASNGHCLRSTHPRGVRRLSLSAAGEFHVTTGTGAEVARLHVASVVTPWLTVMVLRGTSGRRYRVVLLPDNCAAEPFRRLRVRLRRDNRLIDDAGDDAVAP